MNLVVGNGLAGTELHDGRLDGGGRGASGRENRWEKVEIAIKKTSIQV